MIPQPFPPSLFPPQSFPPFPPSPFPPQSFPPSPFPPFLPSPFPPHAGLICRVLASVWLHLVYKSFFPYISYTSTHCGVPTVPSILFRTAEAPPVYQLCPSPRSVPQKPLLCTNYAPDPVPYLGIPPVYQPCPSPRSVPQKPLPCTNYVPHPVPYLRSPSRVPTVSSIPFRTSEAPPVYQPCPSPRFVPRINLF